MPPKPLNISSLPFKSSHLAIPPSPFSPKLPLSPPAVRPKFTLPLETLSHSHRLKAVAKTNPPPGEPLRWLWQCHKCSRVYQLGVTRRCLDDGHYFCAGTTTVRRSRREPGKKIIRHAACASEFDYQGWKAWGTWRRELKQHVVEQHAKETKDEAAVRPLKIAGAPSEHEWFKGVWAKKPLTTAPAKSCLRKNCWDACDYPSECRWGKQYGVPTPVKTAAVLPSSPPEEKEKEVNLPKTSFDDILIDLPVAFEESKAYRDYPEEFETSNDAQDSSTQPSERRRSISEEETRPSAEEVVESVKRRKRISSGAPPSLLGPHASSSTTAKSSEGPATPPYIQNALDEYDVDVKRSTGRSMVMVWKGLKHGYSTGSL